MGVQYEVAANDIIDSPKGRVGRNLKKSDATLKMKVRSLCVCVCLCLAAVNFVMGGKRKQVFTYQCG